MVAPAGVYFLTSRGQWNDYVLPVYARPGCSAGQDHGVSPVVPGPTVLRRA
jgi:hypothetical protein